MLECPMQEGENRRRILDIFGDMLQPYFRGKHEGVKPQADIDKWLVYNEVDKYFFVKQWFLNDGKVSGWAVVDAIDSISSRINKDESIYETYSIAPQDQKSFRKWVLILCQEINNDMDDKYPTANDDNSELSIFSYIIESTQVGAFDQLLHDDTLKNRVFGDVDANTSDTYILERAIAEATILHMASVATSIVSKLDWYRTGATGGRFGDISNFN